MNCFICDTETPDNDCQLCLDCEANTSEELIEELNESFLSALRLEFNPCQPMAMTQLFEYVGFEASKPQEGFKSAVVRMCIVIICLS